MFTIRKSFTFEAAHHLPQMPEGHPCRRPHGHSYTVEVELNTERVDPATGFVRDFGDLTACVREHLNSTLDHRDLAEVFGGGEHTTAERLASILYHSFKEQLPELSAVTVRETARTSATYRPGVFITSEHLTAALRSLGLVRSTDTGADELVTVAEARAVARELREGGKQQ